MNMFDREISGICPLCNRQVSGKVYRKNDKVYLDKVCPEHGTITDMLSSNAGLFADRMSMLEHASPNRCSKEKCRNGIFNCRDHVGRKSPLAFIEITTRCNMRCPVCYIDAESTGRDMPLAEIERIVDRITEEDPNTHLILIGGEPTIHKEFFKILAMIRQKGLMKRTFIATNGITLADKEFCKRVQDAGIKKFYLGFDGTDREACKKIRGSYIAYDSVRKALENIRENGKAWIIISITAVKDLNVEDIPKVIEFAMANSDIVKRIMISPEVFCGRINEKEDLAAERLTGDCIETYLRDFLGVKVATVSISLFFALLRPLKSMGLLAEDSWMTAAPSPFCGQMGLLWRPKGSKFRSVVDVFIKDADKQIYEIGRRVNRLADSIEKARAGFGSGFPGRAGWFLSVYLYFLPKYFFMLAGRLNWKGVFGMLGAFVKAGFNTKTFKKEYFGEKIELFYLLGSDKYNYIWDKMPYCLTHHYRLHPDTGEVIKVPGCFVVAFREEVERRASVSEEV
ncbi:MAG: radical SAM protein [Candidatus Omnitrophica bacterium]|nr:radical SAM protein [Candidatus Omnitrophota bacterium]